MRPTFQILAIISVIVGFMFPAAFLGAIVFGFLAIASAPSGLRADGKPKTGGLLGGFWDDIVIGCKMDDCPFCGSKIMADVQKCKHCGQWVKVKKPPSNITLSKGL